MAPPRLQASAEGQRAPGLCGKDRVSWVSEPGLHGLKTVLWRLYSCHPPCPDICGGAWPLPVSAQGGRSCGQSSNRSPACARPPSSSARPHWAKSMPTISQLSSSAGGGGEGCVGLTTVPSLSFHICPNPPGRQNASFHRSGGSERARNAPRLCLPHMPRGALGAAASLVPGAPSHPLHVA